MANTFSHSLSAFKLIKGELNKLKKILNVVVQLVFVAYCLYLIFSNLDSLAYIIIYSLIFVLTIFTFIIEPVYKIDIDDNKAIKRLKRKERKVVLLFIKSLKYICKMSSIVVAIIEIALQGATDLSIIATIVSGIILIVQIIFDVIVLLVNRYMNILQLAIEEDIRSSKKLQFFLKFSHKDYLDELNEDRETYTEDELAILEKLANIDKVQEEERRKKLEKTPLDEELLKKYSSFKEKARSLLNDKKGFKSLLKQTEKAKFDDSNPEYKQIPNLIEFLKSYKKKEYVYINEDNASIVGGTLLYLEDKDKENDPKKDQIIINKCIGEISAEYNEFLEEKENKKKRHFFKKK